MLVNDILSQVPDDSIVASIETLKGPLSNLIAAYNAIVIGRDPSVEINSVITGRTLKDALINNLNSTEQVAILNDFNNDVKSSAKPDSYETLDIKEERKFKRWLKKTAVKVVSAIVIILTLAIGYNMAVNGESSIDAINAILSTITEIFKIIFSTLLR